MIDHTFNYKSYNKEETNNNRLYVISDDIKVPSVTTILDKTMKEEKRKGLQEWRKNVGEEKAQKVLNTSTKLGSIMHKNIEDHYTKEDTKPTGSPIAVMMSLSIIKHCRFEKVYGCEVSLHHSNLYAGTADCVALEDGHISIVDFKNSVTMKTEEMIEDYFLQLAAYAMAHDFMFQTNIKRGVIKMATQDGKFSEFEKKGLEFERFKTKWAERLEEYYNLAK